MRIVIADDDPLVLGSLKTIVEAASIEVLATANSGYEAIEFFKKYSPDLLLMDIRMKYMTGIEASREILNIDRGAKILLVTTFEDDDYIKDALSIGCRGYILKQSIDSIIPSIEAAYSGNMVFDSRIVSRLQYEKVTKRQRIDMLTKREEEILEYIARGLNNREISEVVCLSEGTIRNYISNMLDKLSLRDRTQLAIYYYNAEFRVNSKIIGGRLVWKKIYLRIFSTGLHRRMELNRHLRTNTGTIRKREYMWMWFQVSHYSLLNTSMTQEVGGLVSQSQ